MELEILLYYIFACFILVIVPGPTVSLIIANTLSSGTRAGILNVIGTQIGLIIMIGSLAFGFEAISSQLEWLLNVIRIVGAIYLIWLGYKIYLMLIATHQVHHPEMVHIFSIAASYLDTPFF